MVHLLRQADVEDLVDLPDAIDCLERVFRDQAEGRVEAVPPASLYSGGAYFGLRAGGISGQQRLGVRINTAGPMGESYALVFESPNGHLLSVMEYPFSDLRLTATVAVGIRCLAPPRARTVAMIGSGRTAGAILPAAQAVRPVDLVRVFSPKSDHRAEFAERMARELDVAIEPADDAQRAVEGADVVLVATNARQPALRGEWLPPETLVVAVGTRMEIDEEVFARASLIVTTSRVHEFEQQDVTDDAPIVRARDAGAIDWAEVAELGDVVAGRRAVPEGIRVFREPRGGFTDVALACLAHKRAIEQGRGTEWEVT